MLHICKLSHILIPVVVEFIPLRRLLWKKVFSFTASHLILKYLSLMMLQFYGFIFLCRSLLEKFHFWLDRLLYCGFFQVNLFYSKKKKRGFLPFNFVLLVAFITQIWVGDCSNYVRRKLSIGFVKSLFTYNPLLPCCRQIMLN